jgi:hypothetical protein
MEGSGLPAQLAHMGDPRTRCADWTIVLRDGSAGKLLYIHKGIAWPWPKRIQPVAAQVVSDVALPWRLFAADAYRREATPPN